MDVVQLPLGLGSVQSVHTTGEIDSDLLGAMSPHRPKMFLGYPGVAVHRIRLLAKAGYDGDCNGGLVGSVLGVMRDVPPAWADPIGDLLETYIKGKERLSIRELAEKTAGLAKIAR